MKNDELDKILDGALSSYSREEPRPGLENRVLSRIRAARERRRFEWLRWAIAIPALACFLLAVTFWSTRPSISKPAQPAQAIGQTGPIAKAAPIAPVRGKVKVKGRRARRMSLPKREEFPTPEPLTDEERELMAFVKLAPDKAREFALDSHTSDVQPLQIKEIHIDPLRASGE